MIETQRRTLTQEASSELVKLVLQTFGFPVLGGHVEMCPEGLHEPLELRELNAYGDRCEGIGVLPSRREMFEYSGRKKNRRPTFEDFEVGKKAANVMFLMFGSKFFREFQREQQRIIGHFESQGYELRRGKLDLSYLPPIGKCKIHRCDTTLSFDLGKYKYEPRPDYLALRLGKAITSEMSERLVEWFNGLGRVLG